MIRIRCLVDGILYPTFLFGKEIPKNLAKEKLNNIRDNSSQKREY